MKIILRRMALVVVVLSAFALGAPALPAAAHPLRYSWNSSQNLHQLCKFSTGCIRSGNIVRFWQSILWADGRFTELSDIDGEFGPYTHNATVLWQSQYVPGDSSGKVGKNTWAAADHYDKKFLDYCDSSFCYFWYSGSNYMFELKRDNDGYWYFRNPRTREWTDTNH
jgi:hypothetical protein